MLNNANALLSRVMHIRETVRICRFHWLFWVEICWAYPSFLASTFGIVRKCRYHRRLWQQRQISANSHITQFCYLNYYIYDKQNCLHLGYFYIDQVKRFIFSHLGKQSFPWRPVTARSHTIGYKQIKIPQNQICLVPRPFWDIAKNTPCDRFPPLFTGYKRANHDTYRSRYNRVIISSKGCGYYSGYQEE